MLRQHRTLEQPRERELAVLLDGGTRLVNEAGEVRSIGDYSTLRAEVFDAKYDTYVRSLLDPTSFPYFADLLADPKAEVVCSRTGGVLGARLTGPRNTARWIGEARVWSGNGRDDPDPELLHDMRAFFDLLRVGVYPTPGATGERLWVRCRPRDGGGVPRRVACPCPGARELLVRSSVGGRCDAPGQGRKLAVAYELDLQSAYVALSQRVPAGTAYSFTSESGLREVSYATYFAACFVMGRHAVAGLPTGPFPVRTRDGRVEYPAQCGRVGPIGLWAEEVAAARAAGYQVDVGAGYVWARWDEENGGWAQAVGRLRAQAPSGAVAGLVKLSAVAAVGRHGMSDDTYLLVGDDDARLSAALRERRYAAPLCMERPTVGGRGASDAGGPLTDAWIIEGPPVSPASRPRLAHWFSHITMQCRLALYERMAAELLAGNTVLATNFDGMILEHPSGLATGRGVGQWRQSRLTQVEIVGARAVLSKERIRLPGWSGPAREKRLQDYEALAAAGISA